MKSDTVFLTCLICLFLVIAAIAVFAVGMSTKQRIEARRACDVLEGQTVHLHGGSSLCFVDGKLVKAAN